MKTDLMVHFEKLVMDCSSINLSPCHCNVFYYNVKESMFSSFEKDYTALLLCLIL